MSGPAVLSRRAFSGGMVVAGATLPLLSCRRSSLLLAVAESPPTPYPPLLDHLVWLASDLDGACAKFQAMTGVAPVYGGVHPGGTHNALIALGPACYLEIAAPQPGVTGGHPWVEAALKRPEPHLYAYSMRPDDSLEAIAFRAAAASIPTLGPSPGTRKMPDAAELRWRLLIPLVPASSGTIPFFIDWIDSRHPALDAPAGVQLTDFRLNHPEPSRIEPLLNTLAPGLCITSTNGPSLVAELSSSQGHVVLTS